MSNSIGIDLAKEAAAIAALDWVKEGMKIGLGTGSTASYFIKHLAERSKQGLKIETVATSEASYKLAYEAGIPLIDINSITSLDLAVDGADEIDSKKRLIKGGGGAAFREKVVAKMSKTFLVIADEKKRVEHLGKFPLAVEVLPFGWKAAKERLKEIGYHGKMRGAKNGELFVTDNGNHIVDIALPYPCKNPEKDETAIKNVTGVIETGFFIGIATHVILGFTDGHTETI